MNQRMSVKNRSDFSRPERQSEMPGRTGMNRVDRKAARLIGRFGQKMSLERHTK